MTASVFGTHSLCHLIQSQGHAQGTLGAARCHLLMIM